MSHATRAPRSERVRTCATLVFLPLLLPHVSSAEHPCPLLLTSPPVAPTAGYSALNAQHSGCLQSDAFSPTCNAAARRLCIALGYASGYGPVEYNGAAATIVCLPAAWTTEFVVPAATLTAYNSACTHVQVPPNYQTSYGRDCHSASYRYCLAMGYAWGAGPLENNAGVSMNIACVRSV